MLSETLATDLQMPDEERRKIVRLMKRIPRGNFLAGIILAQNGRFLRPEEAASDMSAILNILPERRWRERLVAAIALRYAPIEPEQKNEVASALGKALHHGYASKSAIAARSFFLAVGRAGFCFLTAALMMYIGALLFGGSESFEFPALAFFTLAAISAFATPFVFLFSPIWDMAANEKVQIAATETLARLQLPESVGALAKASHSQKCFSWEARAALVQLLPTLTEDH